MPVLFDDVAFLTWHLVVTWQTTPLTIVVDAHVNPMLYQPYSDGAHMPCASTSPVLLTLARNITTRMERVCLAHLQVRRY